MTPGMPQALPSDQMNSWDWQQRWGRGAFWWGYGSQQNVLEAWPSWMRIARLYLSVDNPVAAADALDRAIGAAGSDRQTVAEQVLGLIQQRQLTGRMLPVLRTLAVYLPTDQRAQLAFAEALEINEKRDVAVEVYQRMIRRGVSDLGILARVRQRLDALSPAEAEPTGDTPAGLEAAAAADPQNAGRQLRLARAYYYSLRIDDALATLTALEKIAPHFEGLHDLLIEIHTLRDDGEQLVAALRAKIERTDDEAQQRAARRRLVEELLALGRTDEAIDALKQLADPKEPTSYQRVGMLLHYFGRHDEATQQFELAARSQTQSGGWGGNDAIAPLAKALAWKGDLEGAGQKILASIEQQIRMQSQYAGMAGAFAMFESEQNFFDAFLPLFILYPELLDSVRGRLEAQRAEKPEDLQTVRLLVQLYRRIGRQDKAETLGEEMAAKHAQDQQTITRLIDRAIERKKYDEAIKMAEEWIAQQPKPKLPPGMPPQFAGMMNIMAPQNMMRCKVGDIYWKKGEPDKSFEAYRAIIDEKVDETKIAYASICMLRGRVEEARRLVDDALAAQEVKSPTLLQFRSLLFALEDKPQEAFDALAEALEVGGGQMGGIYASFGEDDGGGIALLAQFATQTDQLERFNAFMEKSILKNRGKWQQYALWAQTLRDAGRLEEAEAVLDRAEKVKTLQRQALEQRIAWGEAYLADDALVLLYESLIEESERKVKPRASLFGGFFGGGSSQEEQIDTQPLRNRLGDLLWDRGEREKATEVWTARMDMKEAGSQLAMANRYREKEADDLARGAYRKALELEPKNAAAHRALAEYAFEDGDMVALLTHLREVFLSDYESKDEPERQYDGEWYPGYGSAVPKGGPQLWAMSVAERVETRPAEAGASDDGEARLMLATLCGQWAELEALLRPRVEANSFDPMVWTLWARTQERNGRWAEAAAAWEHVRRLKRTTITDHRRQLELVLAGERVKEAAAGTRQAATPGAAGPTGVNIPGAMVQYSSRGDDWGGAVGEQTAHLTALYVKLGEFAKAERLYLFAGENALEQSVLPGLAALLRRQGATERAIELFRMSVVMGDNAYQLTSFAQLLADCGELDRAIDLLERGYQFVREERDEMAMYASMFGGWYGGGETERQGFETDEEQGYASALYEILVRHGKVEETLAALKREREERADDPRLARLMLSVQIRDRRWAEAEATLTAMQERCVTVGGETHVLIEPFWVLATQNPIEMEGTYPLPEAQVDRFFFKVNVTPQGEEELLGIIERTTGDDAVRIDAVLDREQILAMQRTVRQVMVAEFVQRYAARIVLATHPESGHATGMTRQFVRIGASPRGLQTLILAAKVRALMADRINVSCQDIAEVTRPALRHRIIRNFEGEAEGIPPDAILDGVLENLAEPVEPAA